MLGCFKARLVPINVNYRYTTDEILYVLDDAATKFLVAEAKLLRRDPRLIERLDGSHRLVVMDGQSANGYERALADSSPLRYAEQRSGDDRYVLYTGGTTGKPKGVVWRVEDLFFAALRGGNLHGNPIGIPDEILDVLVPEPEPWLVTSPMMHGNGQWNSLLPLLTGRGVVLWTGSRFDGAAVSALATKEQVRLLVLVGDAMALPFLDAVEAGGLNVASIKVVASGGAMLSPAVKSRLQAALPKARIVDGFGASETGSSGTMVGSDDESLPRFTVGADVAVLDECLRPVRVGEVGRLARRGRVPLGYWRDQPKTEATFPTDSNGVRWAIPGDLARLEGDGTVTLLGRGSSCINSGGEKVHPDEVTNAIKAHQGVIDALVVGIPDVRFGQAVAALVVTSQPGPTDEDLRAHLRSRLAGYKLPRHIRRVSEVRYTAQGKPDLAWAASAVGEVDA
jgi:fatty-acyl-CoA synthase